MNFIIETDLGHDPDDLFTLCHLWEAGHTILALGLVPGSPEQVHLATGLRKRLQLDFLVGVAKPFAQSEKLGIHDKLIARLGFVATIADGSNAEVFSQAFRKQVDAEVLAIGPAPGLRETCSFAQGNLTFQGGFLPYSLYRPEEELPQFEGKTEMPTFNFNGCRDAVERVLAAPFKRRQFCGKNVCHSILLTRGLSSLMDLTQTIGCGPAAEACGVYEEARKLYFTKHQEKKLHDPVALVCHLRPEIATWFRGFPIRQGSGWSVRPDPEGDFILADIDREKLWHHLLNRS